MRSQAIVELRTAMNCDKMRQQIQSGGVSCRSGEGRMGLKWFGVFHAVLALSLLAACSAPPERTLSVHEPSYATLPNGHDPLKPTQLSSLYATVTTVPGDNVVRYMER